MKKILAIIVFIGLPIITVIAFKLSAPDTVEATRFANLIGDQQKGSVVFAISGCGSCHVAPDSALSSRDKILSGGKEFPSMFGIFIAPNISPHATFGIGTWELIDLANALVKGTSPDKKHYYPAFPYTSYARMTPQDIADLYAYLMVLPPVETPNRNHRLRFPFTLRRGVGLWKQLYLNDKPIMSIHSDDPLLLRGQYLVEGAAHCGECHTQRNFIGGLQKNRWLQGAPNPDGKGRAPNIAAMDWTTDELLIYFTSGFTPEFDVAGGTMGDVIDNLAQISETDRRAIIAYLHNLKNTKRE